MDRGETYLASPKAVDVLRRTQYAQLPTPDAYPTIIVNSPCREWEPRNHGPNLKDVPDTTVFVFLPRIIQP